MAHIIPCTIRPWFSSSCSFVQVFEEMQAANIQPTAATYGCLMVACLKTADADTAVALYKRACHTGVVPSDECHDILLQTCTAANR